MISYKKNKQIQTLIAEFMKEFDNKKFKGTMWYNDNNIHIVARWLNKMIKQILKDAE